MFSKEDNNHKSKTVVRRQRTNDHTPKVHNNAIGRQSRDRDMQFSKFPHRVNHHKGTGKIVAPVQSMKSLHSNCKGISRIKSKQYEGQSRKIQTQARAKSELQSNPKMKFLIKTEKMSTEEKVQLLDALQPKERNEAEQLLRTRKPNEYRKLMARSRKNKIHRKK